MNDQTDDFSMDDEQPPELTKEEFNKLWELNPSYSEQHHDYENTYRILRDELIFGKQTPEGEKVTFNFVYKRYKSYLHIKKLLNDGVDSKYIKKENRIRSIYEYIYNDMYLSIEQEPHGHRHFYFWGSHEEAEISEHFNKFLNICSKEKTLGL